MITDPTIVRIGEAVQLGHQGERESARLLFAEIWDEIGGEQGDPLHRCTLAHAMADMQDDVRQELAAQRSPTATGQRSRMRSVRGCAQQTRAVPGVGSSRGSGRYRTVPESTEVWQVWQTPVRQDQRVGTSQASARSRTVV